MPPLPLSGHLFLSMRIAAHLKMWNVNPRRSWIPRFHLHSLKGNSCRYVLHYPLNLALYSPSL